MSVISKAHKCHYVILNIQRHHSYIAAKMLSGNKNGRFALFLCQIYFLVMGKSKVSWHMNNMAGTTVINLAILLLEKRSKISRKVLDCETYVLQLRKLKSRILKIAKTDREYSWGVLYLNTGTLINSFVGRKKEKWCWT